MRSNTNRVVGQLARTHSLGRQLPRPSLPSEDPIAPATRVVLIPNAACIAPSLRNWRKSLQEYFGALVGKAFDERRFLHWQQSYPAL
jgi:hypothetical protein